ncbi:MAG: HAD family hydrolase [Hyphomicrobiaceae bacterium]|nr:HAD family hydrolase [Hyphomicrobiaceae bacterium]MCC0022921.1 HAD family hydrolase [Hyphomicrobiaceae bacterium]
MTLRALIFDVDGTLAETEEVHRQAFNETFAEHGLFWHWSVDDYRELLKTTGGKERIRAYANSIGLVLDDDHVRRLHADKTRRYGELIASGTVGLRPGIAELIADAAEKGVRLAVATTTNRPNVDALIEATFNRPAGDVFEIIAAGDEVGAKKPAPDVYLLALEGLGLKPADCVAFEDSVNGLLSAKGAGLETIISPSRYTEGGDFSGALAVYDDLRHIASIEKLQNLAVAA